MVGELVKEHTVASADKNPALYLEKYYHLPYCIEIIIIKSGNWLVIFADIVPQ